MSSAVSLMAAVPRVYLGIPRALRAQLREAVDWGRAGEMARRIRCWQVGRVRLRGGGHGALGT